MIQIVIEKLKRFYNILITAQIKSAERRIKGYKSLGYVA